MSLSPELQHFVAAQDAFGSLVARIGDGQWGDSTPCTDWTVRELVNHLVNEQMWATPMLQGMTIEEVGGRLDGDLLGADPQESWRMSAVASRKAFTAPGALDGTINSSAGDEPADQYLGEMTFDLLVHRWDLGRSIGVEQHFSDRECGRLSEVVTKLKPMSAQLIEAGMLAAPVSVDEDATPQTKLLAALGRTG